MACVSGSEREKERMKGRREKNDAGALVLMAKRGGWCFCCRHGRFTLSEAGSAKFESVLC